MMSLNALSLTALLSSVAYLVCAALILRWRRVRPRASRVAFIYTIFSLLIALAQLSLSSGWPGSLPESILKQIIGFGLLTLAIVFLFLTRAYFRTPGFGWRWGILGAAWLASLAILDANPFLLSEQLVFQGGWIVSRQQAAVGLLIAGWAVFMSAATILTLQTLRQAPRYFTAASYWAIVLSLTVLGDSLYLLGQQGYGILLRLIGTLLAAYAVSMPRLGEISHTLRQSIGFLTTTFVAVALYGIGLGLVLSLLQNWLQAGALWIGLVLALILVFLFNPVLGRIQNWVVDRITGAVRDPTAMLRQYSQSITNILDFKLLAAAAVGTASELLDIKRGFLFLVDGPKGPDDHSEFQLRGVQGIGEENPNNGNLRGASALADHFNQDRRPLTQAELELSNAFRDLSSDERKWLGDLDVEIYVPIYAKNEWIGLLALGAKSSGAAYTEQDLALMSTLADQTAVALENTRLVEGLLRLNNDYRRAFAALEQANRHLERLDRTKSDFISVASHELRTPLTIIRGSSQMLLDEGELRQNPYYEQLISKIHIGTLRLHEIIDDMLEMAKIDMRALELHLQPVTFDDLIATAINDLEDIIQKRNLAIKPRDLQGLPPVAADLEALRQVFRHLITNAVKYTPDGGEITISGHEVEPDPGNLPEGGVEVVVRDTGIGIDPRYHELIFVKFYQTGELALHSSGKTKFRGGGPGLGLAIARGIVEAHHGRIWVESPGYDEIKCPGSQFHVVLPLRQTEVALTAGNLGVLNTKTAT
jgi:signal transduction histidine kinase